MSKQIKTKKQSIASVKEPQPKRFKVPKYWEFVPLVLFFLADFQWDIFVATAVLVVSSLIYMGITYYGTGRISKLLLFTNALLVIFGGISFLAKDDMFIKIKPTVILLLFAIFLTVSQYRHKYPLRYISQTGDLIKEEGWRFATWFCIVALIAVAATNEVVWRNFSTSTWVSFKVFGLTAINFVVIMICALILSRPKYRGKKKKG